MALFDLFWLIVMSVVSKIVVILLPQTLNVWYIYLRLVNFYGKCREKIPYIEYLGCDPPPNCLVK